MNHHTVVGPCAADTPTHSSPHFPVQFMGDIHSKARATPFVSVSVPVSIFPARVRFLNYTLQQFSVIYQMGISLFGEVIHEIIENITSL